jgi:hypothetical protein
VEIQLTSVSTANGGFQLSGGITFAMPYFCASSRILCIYWTGSLNSSAVGLYVGASSSPNIRFYFGGSLFGAPCPLRSTVDISSGCALRALRGMLPTPLCATGIAGIGMPPILDFGAAGPSGGIPFVAATRKVVMVAPIGGATNGVRSAMPPLSHPAQQPPYVRFQFILTSNGW